MKLIYWPIVLVWYLIFLIPSMFASEGSGCKMRHYRLKNYLFGTPIPARDENNNCNCWE